MFQKIKSMVKAVAIPLLAGVLSGFLTKDAMELFQSMTKPPFSPPGWLFPVVWSILYILMGISSFLIYRSNSENKEEALSLYLYQLLVNFLWPVFFFSFGWYFFSLLWLLLLWFLVVKMISVFYKISPVAALLNIPYLLWLTFAAYLNAGVWLLN
ncbi:MAG: tryptophan-rich sensory protein [Lachnospiraceae bacterium]|nr:tryptophan-rich sensory protein [Lachnospiraceae bacterium]